MNKWKFRSVGTDLIVKGLLGIVVFIILLLGFNYCISGTLYAPDFWTMISGVITTIAGFIALIIFTRRAIIENLYLSTHDCVVSTFYSDIQTDVDYSSKYNELKNEYGEDSRGFLEAIKPIMSIYFRKCFMEYIDNMNFLEKFVINLYSLFMVGEFSSHLEFVRVVRKDWFSNDNPDYF